MGCDIHMRAEIRRNGIWEAVTEPLFKNAWYDPTSDYVPFQKEFTLEPYSTRNYDVFAILANVRNGRGFAGLVTGDGFNPIAEPKGLPDDIAVHWYEDNRPYWFGDHSFSYLNVAELNAYDWTQVTAHSGWITAAERKEMLAQKKNSPTCWCGGVDGYFVEHIALSLMDERIQSNQTTGHEYAEVTWREPYFVSAHTFYTDTLVKLKELGVAHGDENIRIVFGFDN